ncbi:MAG: hypothetical protein ACP5UC_00130 [Candidatus Micrarchaeia archaeon]
MPDMGSNIGQSGMQQQTGNFGMGPGPKIRPTGVTILAILQILGGIAYLAIGLTSSALFKGLIGGALLFILVPIGLFALITGIALFTGKNWARILALIGGVLELIDIPIGTIVGIIILWYFTRPNVKAYFGK